MRVLNISFLLKIFSFKSKQFFLISDILVFVNNDISIAKFASWVGLPGSQARPIELSLIISKPSPDKLPKIGLPDVRYGCNLAGSVFEKTSSLLTSKVIVSKQSSNEVLNKIKDSIKKNPSKKIIFSS